MVRIRYLCPLQKFNCGYVAWNDLYSEVCFDCKLQLIGFIGFCLHVMGVAGSDVVTLLQRPGRCYTLLCSSLLCFRINISYSRHLESLIS